MRVVLESCGVHMEPDPIECLDSLVIGRHQDDVDVWFGSPYVSRKHCLVVVEHSADAELLASGEKPRAKVMIKDLGSRNGTTVNSVPVLPGDPVEVRDGEIVELAECAGFVVRIIDEGDKETAEGQFMEAPPS